MTALQVKTGIKNISSTLDEHCEDMNHQQTLSVPFTYPERVKQSQADQQ